MLQKAPAAHRSAVHAFLHQFARSASLNTIIARNPNTASLIVWLSSTVITPLGAAKSVRKVVPRA